MFSMNLQMENYTIHHFIMLPSRCELQNMGGN